MSFGYIARSGAVGGGGFADFHHHGFRNAHSK